MRKTVIALVFALVLVGVLAGAVFAYHVPPHRHYILDGAGDKVYVGPSFCEPSVGFDQFHLNVHRGNPALEAFENPNNPVILGSEAC